MPFIERPKKNVHGDLINIITIKIKNNNKFKFTDLILEFIDYENFFDLINPFLIRKKRIVLKKNLIAYMTCNWDLSSPYFV